MKPLKEFVCDKCGKIIEKPEDGYVIWKENEEYQLTEILIVHRSYRDDNDVLHGCDNNDIKYPLSLPLTEFLGADGLVHLLSIIDPGPYFTKEYKDRIANKREFLEFFRRVQIPYYEEARIYWSKARMDGFFEGANEVWTYLPETLKKLIYQYKE